MRRAVPGEASAGECERGLPALLLQKEPHATQEEERKHALRVAVRVVSCRAVVCVCDEQQTRAREERECVASLHGGHEDVGWGEAVEQHSLGRESLLLDHQPRQPVS